MPFDLLHKYTLWDVNVELPICIDDIVLLLLHIIIDIINIIMELKLFAHCSIIIFILLKTVWAKLNLSLGNNGQTYII